jgi:tetratricopeptide (TPR) repeat protein
VDFILRDFQPHDNAALQKLFREALFAHKNGKFVEAEKLCERILKFSPNNSPALQLKALISLVQKRYPNAVELYRRVILVDPKLPVAYLNLGIALKAIDKIDLAIQNYDKAIALNPKDEKSHFNRANALAQMEKFDEAVKSYRTCIGFNADYAEAHANLGNVLYRLEEIQDAIASYDKAISIDPYYAEAYSNRGVALTELNRFDEAIACYEKVITIKPDDAEAYCNLCQIYEWQSDLEMFERILERVTLRIREDNPEILFRRAQLANRQKRFGDAVGFLKKINVEKLRPPLRPEYFNLLGKAYDKLGQFEDAFSAFEKQNELIGASAEGKKFNADRYLDSVLMLKKAWTADVEPNWVGSIIGVGQKPPTFLIGFPRSGTTLLDTILGSHAGIVVAEEKPMVAAMSRTFGQIETIQNLNRLPEADLCRLRDVYFEELKIQLGMGRDGKLVVDKLPLNIIRAGIISRVFPDAKFILLLRHPCDCVLSCFMQTFKLNDAMVNFLSLEQSARLYAAVMELWSLYTQKLHMNMHVLKYEDLVQDFEGTCKSLIKFLGLEWDDNMRNYRKTALDRKRIRTPSYTQVTQPLYKEARGRWTNYRESMEPILPLLRPWIEVFGY